MLNKWIHKIWNWYCTLPWWYKILAVIVLGVLTILIILRELSFPLESKKTESTNAEIALVDAVTRNIQEDNIKLQQNIKEKKQQLFIKVNQATKIDAKTMQRREKITKAKTMKELDELQEEFEL
jgi:hypothetical protein